MAGVASALCEQASSFSGSLVRMVNNHTVDARDGTLCVCVCVPCTCVWVLCAGAYVCVPCACTMCMRACVCICVCVHACMCTRVWVPCVPAYFWKHRPLSLCACLGLGQQPGAPVHGHGSHSP